MRPANVVFFAEGEIKRLCPAVSKNELMSLSYRDRGHVIEFKYFDKNGTFWVLKKEPLLGY